MLKTSSMVYRILVVGVIILICCNYVNPVYALDEDPIIVSIIITPENPPPLSTITFTAEVKGENISEVYMKVKEADENMCMPTRNFSMDKINEEIYECNVTLEYAGATYITYTPVVNCNETWYEFEWRNQTLYREGTIFYVGGTGEGNYTTIQDAIDNASDGDTVFVYDDSSPYYEYILIDKAINLIGEDKNTTVIDGNESEFDVVLINANWVNMSGFKIQNSGNFEYGAGIHFFGSLFCNVTGNIITSNNGSGIILYRGMGGFYSCYNLISDNIITLNKEDGIHLYDVWCNTITGNIISNNGNGINASGDLNGPCSENIISGNTITSNYDIGIKLTMDTYHNFIYHNNFINNSQNAYAHRLNVWDNGYPSGGNFWDDYNGNDSDGDGIGDTPYPIPGWNNEDRYPLGNFRPATPFIEGPTSGKPGVDYNYTFVATDPEGDDICYLIGWGDKEKIYIYGPYPSGEKITLSYNWSKKGTFTISAKTRDIFNAESNWSQFEVKIPRTRLSSYHWFLERFPLLEKLLNLIRAG